MRAQEALEAVAQLHLRGDTCFGLDELDDLGISSIQFHSVEDKCS